MELFAKIYGMNVCHRTSRHSAVFFYNKLTCRKYMTNHQSYNLKVHFESVKSVFEYKEVFIRL